MIRYLPRCQFSGIFVVSYHNITANYFPQAKIVVYWFLWGTPSASLRSAAPPRGRLWHGGKVCGLTGKFLPAFSVQRRSAGPEAGRGVPSPPSLPLDSTHPAMQQLRPPPAAETGSSCWGSGQQDASAAQGTKRMLGAATRRQGLHALDNPKEEVEAQKS